MAAPQKKKDEFTGSFAALRFQFFVTLAMRLILIRDGLATRRSPQETAAGAASTIPCSIASGGRVLEARLAMPRSAPLASVLILHGIGERLDYWTEAQQLLARCEIASLIVHYSGYGKSMGATTPENLRQDVRASYAELQRLVPGVPAPCVLGLSMGTGVAVDAAPGLQPPPSGIILCEPFSSLQDAAGAVCDTLPGLRLASRWLAKLMPDVYRTAATVGRIESPLLIVHSDADELFRVGMAQAILAAANAAGQPPAELAVLHGFAHNDAYLRPSLGYWQPILDFIRRVPGSSRIDPGEPQRR